jgi:hypothetical protein
MEYAITMYAVVYKLVGGNEQRRHSLGKTVIEPGKRGTGSSEFPECGRAQGDTTIDIEPPLKYTFPERLPGYVTGSGVVVDLGECPKCEPPGRSKCPEQVWDYELCKWVGCCHDCCDDVEAMDLPASLYKKNSFGSPASECRDIPSFVGGSAMVVGQGGIKIRKGGSCYEVTSECDPTLFTHTPKVCCDVPQHPGSSLTHRKCYDESHVTYCTCP